MAKPVRLTQQEIEDNLRKGIWTNDAIAGFWDRNARLYPAAEAMVDSKTRLTWAEGNLRINRLALGLLELGLKKDEMLVVQLPNSVELHLFRLACEKAGILCMPVQRNLREREMDYILRQTDAAGVVIPWQFREFNYFDMIKTLRPNLPGLRHVLVEGDKVPEGAVSVKEMLEKPLEKKYAAGYLQKTTCKGTDFYLVMHTTGTTGFPKFVEYPMAPRIFSNKGFIQNFKLTRADILGAFSAASAGANCIAYFTAPEVAAKVVWEEHFNPEEAFQLIEREKITVGLVVPTNLAMMLRHPSLGKYDLRSIRLWWCVGAMLPYPVALETEERLGGKILSGLGATDFGGFTIHPIDAPQQKRLLTLGKGIPGMTDIKLVDDSGREIPPGQVGEVWARGPAAVSGYYRDPKTTAQAWTPDGWFKFGDLGYLDKDGDLVLVGRKKDMIIRAGQNIYPIEIENILLTHPKVAAASIVGVPDPVVGEKACAFVVPKGNEKITFKEMVAFLTEQKLAPYKLPEALEFIDKLPLVAGEKVDKKALQGEATARLQAKTP
ncbi:MAG: AMP-binding protein [Chloroflexi bacterium]|nr:AMP-binding protein [Chloroflexota bacterium]